MMREMNVPLTITVTGSQETIEYAADELCKYLVLMADKRKEAVVQRNNNHESGGIRLGLFDDFNISFEEINDPARDDAVYIDVSDSKGIIAGSNPRSVLFAVYRFLEANGCRWLRPGKDGEIVPRRDIGTLEGNISERASMRFRGNHNGAWSPSLEQTLDKIEWMPKVGLNTFFRELFMTNREYHSLKKPETRSDVELTAYSEQIIRAVKKRGLICQSAGHGWSGAFFGLSEPEWFKDKTFFNKKLQKEDKQYLALVDGKRGIHHSRGPRFTELCYGNPEVRKRLVHCVADYAEANPAVDMVHFWLSDAMNAHCECELCRDTRPSDFYVMMLNMIDEELEKRDLDTRIVFLVYQDLLWAPERENIKNPDRFVMMFAPVKRKYSEPYSLKGSEQDLPPYELNNNAQPAKLEGFITSLRNWQHCFSGEAFAYDYHMTWYHYFDQGYYEFTKVMAEDIRRLPALELNGFVSCQVLRSSFPTGFPMYLHARILWNPEQEVEDLASEYFAASFGKDGKQCLAYMKRLSELFVPDYFYSFKTDINKNNALDKLSRVDRTLEKFRPVVEKNMQETSGACSLSWRYLFLHAELAALLARALRARAEGNQEVADAYWTQTVEYIMVNENSLDMVFDPYYFYSAFERSLFTFLR